MAVLTTNAACTSITLDVLVLVVAIFVFVGIEFWGVGFSVVSFLLFVAVSGLIGVSTGIPLYLAFRELRVDKVPAFSPFSTS